VSKAVFLVFRSLRQSDKIVLMTRSVQGDGTSCLQRKHSEHMSFLATAQRASRRYAFLTLQKRCKNDVKGFAIAWKREKDYEVNTSKREESGYYYRIRKLWVLL